MRFLFAFFLLTYIISWSFFGAGAAVLGGRTSPSQGAATISGILIFLGVITPSIVALVLTGLEAGRAEVRALLGRVLKSSVSFGFYLFAAGYIAVIKLTAALLHRLATGAWPQFGQTPLYIMIGAIMVSTPVQAGEEIGWRGYALYRMAERLGLPRASILLGIIWALWHLPLFFAPVGDTYHQSFPLYLLQVTALSVAMAWLYWRTGGSLLLTMLMHASVNNTKDIVPSAVAGATNAFALSTSLVAWLTVMLLWLCAIYFLFRMRHADVGLATPKISYG
jgi:membrane protease YdiL (CAAX protease family)